MGVPKTEVQKSDKTGKTTTPASKMRRGKKKVGQPLDPALQKILHRETVTNNEAVASSPSKMSNKSSLTEEAIDEILNRLATCENSIDKSDLFILFKLESWKILSRNLDRNSEVLANVIKSLSSGLILNIVPKLMVDLLTKFQSTEENSDSAKLLQNCLKVLCENSESRKAFFQSFESHLFKFVDSPVEMHASLIENLSVVGNESQGPFKESTRSLILSMLTKLESKLHFKKTSVVPAIEVYMNYLCKDILNKLDPRSDGKINPTEAKVTFSQLCRKLKDFVYDNRIKYIPFVYVTAASIHSSFAEHLVRVLWDSFKLDHSLMCLHWLVSFVCDTNLVPLPLVKDVMRHISLFMCKLMKKECFSAVRGGRKRSSVGLLTKQEETSSEEFVVKQAFVYAFYALTALLVQFDHELTESELQLAFVKSLRFDKFICSKLQPLGLIPNELSKQFMSIAESHSNLFPNMRCFSTVSSSIPDDEKKDLRVKLRRIFQTEFDLEQSKWAVEPFLRSTPDKKDEVKKETISAEASMIKSNDLDNECEHAMDLEDLDELHLYQKLNSASVKVISDWLI